MSTNLSDNNLESTKFIEKKNKKISSIFFETSSSDNHGKKRLKSKWLLLLLILIFVIIFAIIFATFLMLSPRCPLKNERANWWDNEMVYQIEVSHFKDTDGDGIGDIYGVIEKLDYIKELGSNIICLIRVNSKDTVREIDEMYGGIKSLEVLIKELKSRDMKLIIDFPIHYLAENDQEIIEHWLKNYVDGLRISDLKATSEVYSHVKIQKLSDLVNNMPSESPKYFGVDSINLIKGLKTHTDRSFLEIKPNLLEEPDKINELIENIYESDISPSLMLGDFYSKRIKSLYKNRNRSQLVHGIILLLKGTPFIMYGDEKELEGTSEIENMMQWDTSNGCGFTENVLIGNYFKNSTKCHNTKSNRLTKLLKDLSSLRPGITGNVKVIRNNEAIAFLRGTESNVTHLILVNPKYKPVKLNLEYQILDEALPKIGEVIYSFSVENENIDDQATLINAKNIQVLSGQLLIIKLSRN